jgi:hypothetical protein
MSSHIFRGLAVSRFALVGLALGSIVTAQAACSDDDPSTTPSGSSSGATSSGSTSGTSGSSGTSGATSGGGTSGATSGGTSGQPAAPSAYERLGGAKGVRDFVSAEVAKVLEDADLKTYFFRQVATPIPAGHPSAAQITECFSRLVGSVVKGETYPGTPVVDAMNTNTPNFTCRTDFAAMHAGLRIGDKTFDKFVGVLAADLMPLVEPDANKPLVAGKISQAEFDTVAKALTDTKTPIVDPGAPSGPAPFTPAQ